MVLALGYFFGMQTNHLKKCNKASLLSKSGCVLNGLSPPGNLLTSGANQGKAKAYNGSRDACIK